jgi:hypothetical protein
MLVTQKYITQTGGITKMQAAHEEEYKGYKIEIHYDDHNPNPRKDYDNFGTLVQWHRRMSFGDKDLGGPEHAEEAIEEASAEAAILLPVYMYEHSGCTINTTGFSCPWDSGQVGFIYCTKEQILKEFGGKKLSMKKLEKAREILQSEIETLDKWLRGDIYGFIVKKPVILHTTQVDTDGNTVYDEDEEEFEDIDSCYGFYGMEYCLEEAKSIVDAETVGTA